MKHIPTRDELITAMNDPDATNPLAFEVATALVAITDQFAEQTDQQGQLPAPFIAAMPETEIQAYALELFTSEISRLGVKIVFKSRAH